MLFLGFPLFNSLILKYTFSASSMADSDEHDLPYILSLFSFKNIIKNIYI